MTITRDLFPYMLEMSVLKFLQDNLTNININGSAISPNVYGNYPSHFILRQRPIVIATMTQGDYLNIGLGNEMPLSMPATSGPQLDMNARTFVNNWSINIFTRSTMENRIIAGKIHSLLIDVADGVAILPILEFSSDGSTIVGSSGMVQSLINRKRIIQNTAFDKNKEDYLTNFNLEFTSWFVSTESIDVITGITMTATSFQNPPITAQA